MGLAHSPRIVSSGLMLYLDSFNTKSYIGSGTTWSDISNNRRNCTFYNGPPTYAGGILTFDGLDDLSQVASPSGLFSWTPDTTFNQSMTLSVWIKTSDTSGYIISKAWNGLGQYNYRILPGSFDLVAGTTGTTSNSISFGRSLANGAWVNIVCWMNSTDMGYYINSNEFSGSKAHLLTNNIPSSGNGNVDLSIMSLYPYGAGWAGNAAFSVSGNLGIVQIYNRVLSSAEVNQNYAALRGRFGV